MKRFAMLVAVVAALALSANVSLAKDEAPQGDAEQAAGKVKTVSGKSACATCEGLTAKGHQILITADDGTRWVLTGDSASYKAAHKVRQDEKKMTAKLAGDPVTKKDDSGKEYKEAKVSEVKVEEEKKA